MEKKIIIKIIIIIRNNKNKENRPFRLSIFVSDVGDTTEASEVIFEGFVSE